MFTIFGFFSKNTIARYSFIGVAALIAAQLIILWRGIAPSGEAVFLHYTTYLGVDLTGVWYMVYLIPIATLVIGILNMALACLIASKDQILVYLLSTAAAFLALLLTIQAVLIVMINS